MVGDEDQYNGETNVTPLLDESPSCFLCGQLYLGIVGRVNISSN